MNCELQGISNFCGLPNLAGILQLDYAPIAWINQGDYERMISSANNWQKAIPFAQGDWLNLPILPDRDNWEESQSADKQAPHYTQNLQHTTPKLRAEVTGEFAKMANQRFLVKLTDNDAAIWLIGTLEHPLQFEAKAQSGTKIGESKAYTCRFFGKTKHRAAGYVPVV